MHNNVCHEAVVMSLPYGLPNLPVLSPKQQTYSYQGYMGVNARTHDQFAATQTACISHLTSLYTQHV